MASTVDFEVWGDGEQTRSFMFVDDCVEGILRIMMSDFEKPLNLGTEEMVSMNEFAEIAMSFEDKALPIRHIPGPQGVRGRNSDNTLIREKIGWEPSISISEGLREVRLVARPSAIGIGISLLLTCRSPSPRQTYFWIKEQIEKERAAGIHNDYASSKVRPQI